MKRLLPLVNTEVGYSIAHYMGSKFDKVFIKNELSAIKKENPVVADFIKRWAKLEKNPTHSIFCGILVYKLLRSQAEADDLLF